MLVVTLGCFLLFLFCCCHFHQTDDKWHEYCRRCQIHLLLLVVSDWIAVSICCWSDNYILYIIHTRDCAGIFVSPAPLRTSLKFFRNFKYLSGTWKQECDINLKQNITLLIKAYKRTLLGSLKIELPSPWTILNELARAKVETSKTRFGVVESEATWLISTGTCGSSLILSTRHREPVRWPWQKGIERQRIIGAFCLVKHQSRKPPPRPGQQAGEVKNEQLKMMCKSRKLSAHWLLPSDNLSLLGPFFSSFCFLVDQSHSHSLFHLFDKWILAQDFSVDKMDRICINPVIHRAWYLSVKYGEFSVNATPVHTKDL